MQGVEHGKVRLSPHDERWAQQVHITKAELIEILADNVIDVHHVGSTAIAEIDAKPILDVAVVGNDLGAINAAGMQRAGYEDRGEQGIAGRRLFVRRTPQGLSTHHIHVYPEGHDNLRDTLLFCRYLIEHSQWARRYHDRKHELAEQYPTDRGAYTDGKAAVIQEVIQRAKTAYSETAYSE